MRLLTNNPSKIDGLRSLGVDVRARVALPPSVTAENAGYLHAKADRMNHWLAIERGAEPIPVTSRRDGHDHRVR